MDTTSVFEDSQETKILPSHIEIMREQKGDSPMGIPHFFFKDLPLTTL